MKKEEHINYQYGLGAVKDPKDRRDFRICGITKDIEIPVKVFSLPEKFEVNNQFSRGSCTSQSQAHHKERQEDIELSARFIMAMTKDLEGNTEYGAITRNSFKIVQKYGACAEKLYGEPNPDMSWEEYIDKSKIPQECFKDARNYKSQSYWRVNKTINDIKQTLYQYKNSIVISMKWYREFRNDNLLRGKILPSVFKKYVGGHAVECSGFDDEQELFRIKNSWGRNYGEDGYFYMPYWMLDKLVWDCHCSLDIEKELPVDNRYGQKRTWSSYLAEKIVAFSNPWLYNKIKRLPSNREINSLIYGKWSYEETFLGEVGDIWLKMIKPEAKKQGLI